MKIIFVIFGFLFLGLGIFGIYMPLVPATPFLLLSTACFAKGSERFHNWFINTKIYRDNIEPLKDKRGMTNSRKIKILSLITIFIIISFMFMKNIHGRVVLLIVLVFHYWYFIFKVKTRSEEDDR